MDVPVWPAELPQRALVDGYSEQWPNVLLRSAPEQGPPKTRLAYSAGVEPITPTLSLQLWQTERLRRFWEDDIGKGSIPFWWPDQRRDGVPLLDEDGVTVLTDEDGEPLLTTDRQLVLMPTPPVITKAPRPSVTWRAQLSLEVLP